MKILRHFFHPWGFESAGDYIASVLGIKAMSLFSFITKLAGAFVAALITIVADWIWQPPGAAVLLVVMDFANAWYGYRVSVEIKKDRFTLKKAGRTIPIVISTLFLLSMVRGAVGNYPYYDTLGHLLFGWLFAYKFGAIINHMALLKLQDGGLATYLRTAILNLMKSRIGANIVDNIQKEETAQKKKKLS